jgi:TonB family protein
MLVALILLASCASTGAPSSAAQLNRSTSSLSIVARDATASNESRQYYGEMWRIVRSLWTSSEEFFSQTGLLTEIMVEVEKDGRISYVEITVSSGSAGFDESVMAVIRSIERLPPAPRSISSETVTVFFKFRLSSTGGK